MYDDVESIYENNEAVDASERAMGFLVGMFWPLIVAGALVTGNLPPSPRQQAKEIERRGERIAALERELGIGHDA